MIEGLKLTMTGADLRRHLSARIEWHRERVLDYEREMDRGSLGDPGEVRLPAHVVEHMRDEHESRAGVLAFIREHVLESETYRLGEGDLVFGELIPGPGKE